MRRGGWRNAPWSCDVIAKRLRLALLNDLNWTIFSFRPNRSLLSPKAMIAVVTTSISQ
jgi:hypothetical protein